MTIRKLCGVLGCLLTIAACTAEEPSVATTESGVQVPSWFADELERASGLQARLLEDGVVTEAELEQAFLANVACVEDAGYEVTVTIDPVMKWYGLDIEHGDQAGAAETAGDVLDQCRDDFFSLVLGFAAYQDQLSEEELAERDSAVIECLRQRGFDIEGNTREDLLRDTAEGSAALAYGECLRAEMAG